MLKNIPDAERQSLSASAAAQNISVSDIVRRQLCARYHLDCPPESYGYDADRDRGSANLLLRLQPRLKAALDREAEKSARSKRDIIIETIQKGAP